MKSRSGEPVGRSGGAFPLTRPFTTLSLRDREKKLRLILPSPLGRRAGNEGLSPVKEGSNTVKLENHFRDPARQLRPGRAASDEYFSDNKKTAAINTTKRTP